jgi:hypothetical protein
MTSLSLVIIPLLAGLCRQGTHVVMRRAAVAHRLGLVPTEPVPRPNFSITMIMSLSRQLYLDSTLWLHNERLLWPTRRLTV